MIIVCVVITSANVSWRSLCNPVVCVCVFVCLYVWLYVCYQGYSKSYQPIWLKLGVTVGPINAKNRLIFGDDPISRIRIPDDFSTSFSVAECSILGDLLVFLIQSPTAFHKTRLNDWSRQKNEPTTFWERSGWHLCPDLSRNPDSNNRITFGRGNQSSGGQVHLVRGETDCEKRLKWLNITSSAIFYIWNIWNIQLANPIFCFFKQFLAACIELHQNICAREFCCQEAFSYTGIVTR